MDSYPINQWVNDMMNDDMIMALMIDQGYMMNDKYQGHIADIYP